MNKEEILESNCPQTTFIDDDALSVLQAMEEYAKQEAIAFSIWVTTKMSNEKEIVWDYTNDELYDQYLKSKQ